MENISDNNAQDSFVQQNLPVVEKLKGAWQLSKDAWHLYCSKFTTFAVIMILPVALAFIFQGSDILSLNSQIFSQSLLFSIAKIILYLLVLYFGTINILAISYAIKNESGALRAYSEAIKNSFAYIRVVIFLMSVVVFPILIVSAIFLYTYFHGEFMDFYLSQTMFSVDSLPIITKLLIVPAFIVSLILFIYFSFSIFVFSFEEKRGFETIWTSKKLVSGNFWKIIWRLLVFAFFILLVIAIPLGIAEQMLGDKYQIIIGISKIFVTPFIITFGILLYKNISEVKVNVNFEKPAKISRIIYYFSVLIALPLLLLIFIFQTLSLVTYDSPKQNDSDLQLPVLSIPKQSNAYYKFSEANDTVYWPDDNASFKDLSENKNWDDKLANEILEKNKTALANFDEGLTCPIYSVPEVENPANINANLVLKSMSSIRKLARINSIKALVLMKQGKEREAVDQSIKTLRMGKMLQEGRITLIDNLIGIATKEIGLSNLRDISMSANLSSADLISYGNELSKYEVDKMALINIYKSMYIDSVNNNRQLFESSLAGKRIFWYKPNKTQNLYVEMARKNISSANSNDYASISKEDYSGKTVITPGIIFTENAIGKILFNIVAIDVDGGVEARRFQEVFSIRATRLLFAMKAYKQDNGNLPDSLDKLFPNYISEIPRDPFDGKTIRYSVNDKIIYSVGKDLADDGGNMGNTWSSGNDLVFKIDF